MFVFAFLGQTCEQQQNDCLSACEAKYMAPGAPISNVSLYIECAKACPTCPGPPTPSGSQQPPPPTPPAETGKFDSPLPALAVAAVAIGIFVMVVK